MKADENIKFADRAAAGRALAVELKALKLEDPVILAIPRGAVPIGKILADELGGELDILLVHKFAWPDQPEVALGSVTEGGEILMGHQAEAIGLRLEELLPIAQAEIQKLKKQRRRFGNRRHSVEGRDVVIVDDGIATGATVLAAIQSLKDQGAKRIVVAAPVASSSALSLIEESGVEICVPLVPRQFRAVGQFIEDFTQVEDEDVIRILSEVSR